jgi:Flp pilus assembly CpaF family ATPase
MNDLIERRMISVEQAQQLTGVVRLGDNVLISVGAGTSKTTLTNVIACLIPNSDIMSLSGRLRRRN